MENSIKCNWYSAKIPTKKWNEYYSKINSYTFLDGNKDFTNIGFLAVIPPLNCLEITNQEELRKIQLHREAINMSPLPFEKIECAGK